MKPFKPLTIGNRNTEIPTKQVNKSSEPPIKKRRVSNDEDEYDRPLFVSPKPSDAKKTTCYPRQPLESVKSLNVTIQPQVQNENKPSSYFLALWRKPTNKKHKTWDGDGVLVVTDTAARLHDSSGRVIGRGTCKESLEVGSSLQIGGNVVEIDAAISREEYLAKHDRESTPKRVPTIKSKVDGVKVSIVPPLKQPAASTSSKRKAEPKPAPAPAPSTITASFKAPLLDKSAIHNTKLAKTPTPRHDPSAENALVLPRPTTPPKDKQIIDVVVDPQLSKSLRQHQREGVRFMYECVMGMREHVGEGTILADEMGLGKTLQTITLLWTLLKQNPIWGEPPLVHKALIVCPVTLINNWRTEFRKWLGLNQIHVFVDDGNKSRLRDFTLGKVYNVMIIGYEKLVKVQEELHKCKIDIVILDEGHRLKTEKNKAGQAIKSFNTGRRIVLTGTPLQNDLAEFYALVDIINPGLLGKYNAFKKSFETPILKSRQPGATKSDIQKGEECSQELAEITKGFILRRTADILTDYLPPKTEHVVFCRPTATQLDIYQSILDSPAYSDALGSSALALELITLLRKLCNSPSLLHTKDDRGQDTTKPHLLPFLPRTILPPTQTSTKLVILTSLLHHLRATTTEKVVIISNFTSTLDLISTHLTSHSHPHLRLDGTTPSSQRHDLVTRFNRSPSTTHFAFLLSARAGGTGLNLIGASRLILFDPDWNPAVDAQAMARIHRDGQKRACVVYRLLMGEGAMDEKIFQRQVVKKGLAASVVDGVAGGSGFSQAELRDLFSIMGREEAGEKGGCGTHALLGCGCGGVGEVCEVDVSEGVEKDGEGEDKEILPPSSSFRTGVNQQSVDEEDEERQSRENAGKVKMMSLMQYRHFDIRNADNLVRTGSRDEDTASHSSDDISVDDEHDIDEHADREQSNGSNRGMTVLESAIEDEALRHVIRETKQVAFVMTK